MRLELELFISTELETPRLTNRTLCFQPATPNQLRSRILLERKVLAHPTRHHAYTFYTRKELAVHSPPAEGRPKRVASETDQM